MVRKLALSIILCSLLCSAASARLHDKTSRKHPSRSDITLEKRIKRVEHGLLLPVAIKGQPNSSMTLVDRMRFYRVPAVSIAVIDKSSIAWARAYGVKQSGASEPVDVETLFQAASISKPIVAAATLHLVDRGKLRLDEEVNKRLVSWQIPENEFTRQRPVTLRHLLAHSGGLTNHEVGTYGADQKVPTLIESLEGKPPARNRPVYVDYVPGSRWRYSGGGYSVLQQLLIDVAGSSFPAFMDETVLKPLSMTHSFYEQPLAKEHALVAAVGHRFTGDPIKGGWVTLPEMAAGGLWSTPSDLALFVIELQKSAAGRSNTVLSKAATSQMLTPQISNMGLGITVEGRGRSLHFSHGGSNPGFRCLMVGYARTGQGAVVMTNSDLGADLVREIIRSIAAEYKWPDYQPVIRQTVPVDAKVFETYVGQYDYAPGRSITVTTENGRLFAQESREFKSEILPESATTYFSLLYNTELRFVLNEKGQAVELIAHWADDEEVVKAKRKN
ncbi:MAG TPA: serine hydrolase [Pyrinomonadaceae bacterium]|nr:serine hydrolase [Pyrinomonadaceae bacterium]